MSGSSGESETFYNAPLATGKTFDVLSFECWTLEHAALSLSSSAAAAPTRSSMHPRSVSLDPRYGSALQNEAYKSFYESLSEANTNTRLGRSQSLSVAAVGTLASGLSFGDERVD